MLPMDTRDALGRERFHSQVLLYGLRVLRQGTYSTRTEYATGGGAQPNSSLDPYPILDPTPSSTPNLTPTLHATLVSCLSRSLAFAEWMEEAPTVHDAQ